MRKRNLLEGDAGMTRTAACSQIAASPDEKGCKVTSCQHNMFWDKLNLSPKAQETPMSLSSSNCMRFPGEEMTLQDISEMWGLTRERVRQIERDAIMKLLSLVIKDHKLLREFELNGNFLREKLGFLKTKKYNTHPGSK
jgi:hypothetical protein